MHQFHPGELERLDLDRTEITDAAGELGPVQVADPHDFTGDELALTPRDSRRQQTPSFFAQGLLCPFVHEQSALGVMKEGNPALAAFEPGRLRNE